ncbi:MAG: cytochrome c [Chloroflexi bacterium]|nr:cytochrome c [Chloroflexota bacterium]
MDDPFIRHKYMGLFLVFFTLIFFPTYLVWEVYLRQPQAVEELRVQRENKGISLFAQYCVTCHGKLGEGFIAPPLNREEIRTAEAEDLYKVISRGRGAMPAWLREEGGALDSEDIRSLIAFIQADPPRWAEVAGAIPTPTPCPEGQFCPTPTPEPPAVAGRRIFNSVCAVCHAFDGEGDIGPRLQDNEFVQSLTDEGLYAFLQVGRPDLGMPAWEGKFTDEEFSWIIAFLRSLQPQ